MATAKKVMCPFCERVVTVTPRGYIRAHHSAIEIFPVMCKASGLTPAGAKLWLEQNSLEVAYDDE